MSTFKPTHTIRITFADGKTEKIEVRADDPTNAEGPLYTRAEWDAEARADWEYDAEVGLTFQGKPGGPWNFAEYTLRQNG